MGAPKPKLVLRIGVTGHRSNRFTEAAQLAVKQSLNGLFGQISVAAAALQQRETNFFASSPPQIRIVSALADGADRVVAEAGLDADFALDAVLPFPVDVYETDFQTPESKAQYHKLLEVARSRFILSGTKDASDPSQANRAYEAVGLMMLRQCDLLITIWDGKEASGRGGTEDIVQSAITSGRPVLRFDEKGNGPFLLSNNNIEPADARDLVARAATSDPNVDAAVVAGLVEHLCAPPTPSREKDRYRRRVVQEASGYLKRFLNEKEKRPSYLAFSYPLILRVLGGRMGFRKSFRRKSYVEAAKSDWANYLTPLNNVSIPAVKPITEILLPRFAWADNMANRYSQLHRSGYVSNFMLAAFAVLFAAMGEELAPAELAVIMLIILITVLGNFQGWHKRWIDYRQLSAELRQVRALALTGSSIGELRDLHTGEELQSGPLWVNWYFRMTAREIGIVDAKADAKYIKSAREAIGRGEIDDQIGYHEQNTRRMKSTARWLDTLSYVFFGLTLFACGYETVVSVCAWARAIPKSYQYSLELSHILSIILPAFGTALFGIRVHGDFEGSAERSADMVQKLRKVSAKLNGDVPMSFAELSAQVEYAAIVMESEIGDWGFIYRARPLALPT